MEGNLPLGQINPAARPVSDFIRPAQLQPAAPSAPPSMPAPQGINTIQAAGQASFQGANRFQELAEALAPFNRALTSTLQAGAEGLAAWASQRGEQQAYQLNAKNQAMAALSTADRTNEAGSFDYAAANRDLARRDPEGGFLMDLLNPYREAGVRRGLSKLAGIEAETGLMLAYDKVDPAVFAADDRGMGALLKLRSTYTAELAQRYGLDTSTPGFINHALPRINSAWEKLLNRASQDRKDYLKSTFPPLAAAEVRGLYAETLSQFKAGATEIVVAGQRFPATDRDAIYGALWAEASRVIDGYAGKMGLPGETMGLVKSVAEDLLADANMQQDPGFRFFVNGLRVGPVLTDSRTGQRTRFTVSDLFTREGYDSQIKYGEAAFRLQQRQNEQLTDTFSNQLSADLVQLAPEDYAGRQALVNRRIAEFQKANPGAPLAPMLKAAKDLVGVVGDIQGIGYAPDAGVPLLSDLRERYGAAWDPVQARREANAALPSIEPGKRGEFLGQVESIIREKEGKGGTTFRTAVTRQVEAAKDAALAREYGGDWREAVIRNVPGALDSRGANIKEAVRRYNAALYPYVNQRIEAEAARLKRPLNEAEAGDIAARAVAEYGTKSDQGKAAYRGLFPGGAVSKVPAVPGTSATPASSATPGEKGKPAAALPTFSSEQLDEMPRRAQRLLNYQNETILNRKAISAEMQRAMNGQPFSPALKRAAMDARARTPAEFLAAQARRWGIEIDQEVLRDLNKRSEAITTPQRYLVSLASTTGPALARVSRWALDAVTGAQPAAAMEFPPFGRQAAQQVAFNPYRGGPTGGGGGGRYVGAVAMGGRRGMSSDGLTQTLTGIRGDPSYDANHGEGNDHVHHGAPDPATAMALAKHLRAKGYPITEFKSWGRVGRHQDPGHYNGGSFDVPVPTSRHREVMAEIDRFYAARRGSGRQLLASSSHGGLVGEATYYAGGGGSDGVLGGRTANGEVFTGKGMTAAVQLSLRPKLLNKWLIVEDLDTGKSIRVWANDTGSMGGTTRRPGSRIVDLSPAAFRRLYGSTSRGVGRVRVRIDPSQAGRP